MRESAEQAELDVPGHVCDPVGGAATDEAREASGGQL